MKKTVFLTVFLVIASFTFAQNFTWMRGSPLHGPAGVYGTMGIAAPGNDPGGRHGSATWTDASGNLWLFGGEGFDTTNTLCWLNDLWKYDKSTNQWTWVRGSNGPDAAGVYGTPGIPASTNEPGAREFMMSWTDASGKFWMFGGDGFDDSQNYGRLGDLWRYDPLMNEWTFMKGFSTINQPGVYGTQGTTTPTNMPGGRYGCGTWTDASGNLWLFGGVAPQSGPNLFNDLWKYDITTNNWTWVSGSNNINQLSIHGTLGVPASSNIPGGREFPGFWYDGAGKLYLFGGTGFSSSNLGRMNDLWTYDIVNNEWTWIHGANISNQLSVYGPPTLPSASITPGARYSPACWKDLEGKFWMFGGYGYANAIGNLSDLYKYDPLSNEWAYVKGHTTVFNGGVYGTQGVAHPANVPGGRFYNTWWKETSDAFWLIGGRAQDSTATTLGDMNDLWRFKPPCNPDSILTTAMTLCSGSTATLTAFNQFPASVSWYISPASTMAIAGGSVYGTAPLTAIAGQSVITFYASSNNCTMSPRTAVNITVNPLPLINISGPDAICLNDTLFLSVTGAASYTWNHGPNTSTAALTPTANPYTAIVLGTSAEGCENSSIKAFTVHPLPGLTLTAIAPPKLCSGSPATLIANGADTYSWSNGQTNGTIVITPSITTTYTVKGSNAYNCTVSDVITQVVDICSGIKANRAEKINYTVFPNPGTGSFRIVCSQEVEGARVIMLNALSQVVLSENMNTHTKDFNTRLPAGIYQLVIETLSGEKTSMKLIIDK